MTGGKICQEANGLPALLNILLVMLLQAKINLAHKSQEKEGNEYQGQAIVTNEFHNLFKFKIYAIARQLLSLAVILLTIPYDK